MERWRSQRVGCDERVREERTSGDGGGGEILMAGVIERRAYERRDKGQSLRSPCSFQKSINIKSFSLPSLFQRNKSFYGTPPVKVQITRRDISKGDSVQT